MTSFHPLARRARNSDESSHVEGNLSLGFVLLTVCKMVDIGDRDLFALNTLQWTEDTVELLFVSTYLSGLMLLLIKRNELTAPAAAN